MSDLSSDGKALVEAGRRADRPSDADRERVLAALRERLGDAALLATGLEQAAPKANGAGASRSQFIKWGWVAPTVLVTGALWLTPRVWPSSTKAVPAPSASVAVVETKPAAVVSAVPEPAPEVPPQVPQEAPPSPSAPAPGTGASRAVDTPKAATRSRDGLTEEVALLSRAETELHAGRPAKALLALAEHQRKFPRGALAEERTAARIQALCALGRNDEANAQLKQLLHISPNSAQEERARQACRGSRAVP
jgi:hypothetical protein